MLHVGPTEKLFNDLHKTQLFHLLPDVIGINFAADEIKQNHQLILVIRETVTAYTAVRLIADEKAHTLRETLLILCMDLHPLDGPRAVFRVDLASGFLALCEDALLDRYRINLEISRVKNTNKNPVAEKAVVGNTKTRTWRRPVTQHSLSTAVARLNTRFRSDGLSARCTHDGTSSCMNVVVSKNDDLLSVEKFVDQQLDQQLESNMYKVKTSECYFIPTEVQTLQQKHQHFVLEDGDQEEVATLQHRIPETSIFGNLDATHTHRKTFNPGFPSIPEVLYTPPCAIEVGQETPQGVYRGRQRASHKPVCYVNL